MHVCFCCVCFSFSVSSQEIGWEERLGNDLFCVKWDVKPQLNQSHSRESQGKSRKFVVGLEKSDILFNQSANFTYSSTTRLHLLEENCLPDFVLIHVFPINIKLPKLYFLRLHCHHHWVSLVRWSRNQWSNYQKVFRGALWRARSASL